MQKRYSHAFALAFELSSYQADGEDVTGKALREALALRIANLTDEELVDAVGAPLDTYEIKHEG